MVGPLWRFVLRVSWGWPLFFGPCRSPVGPFFGRFVHSFGPLSRFRLRHSPGFIGLRYVHFPPFPCLLCFSFWWLASGCDQAIHSRPFRLGSRVLFFFSRSRRPLCPSPRRPVGRSSRSAARLRRFSPMRPASLPLSWVGFPPGGGWRVACFLPLFGGWRVAVGWGLVAGWSPALTRSGWHSRPVWREFPQPPPLLSRPGC